MALITAKPKGIFSWGFDLFIDQKFLAAMDINWFKEGGSFEFESQNFTMKREGLMSGEFQLFSQYYGMIAKAVKPSAFIRSFEISFSGRQYVLKAKGPVTRAFELLEYDKVVGDISPDSAFTRRCTIHLPDTLSVPQQLFIFWLVAILWKRDTD